MGAVGGLMAGMGMGIGEGAREYMDECVGKESYVR